MDMDNANKMMVISMAISGWLGQVNDCLIKEPCANSIDFFRAAFIAAICVVNKL